MNISLLRSIAVVTTVVALHAHTLRAQTVPRWRATVDLTIGGANADENAMFNRISGLAMDAAGRIFVADAQDQQIRVFSPTGAYVMRIGRSGSGPLEFKRLANIGFASDGLLWTRDDGNARMLAIDVSATPARGVKNVPLTQFTGGTRIALTFEPDGSLIDESTWYDKSTDSFRPLRLRRTLTGTISRTDTLPVPAGAFAGVHKVNKVQKDASGKEIGMAQMFYWQPHGPEWLRAYGPGGLRADVVTSRYDVRVYDGNSNLLRTLTRNVPPVPLSAREKQKADSTLDAAKVELPFRVPATKPFIASILWSQDGQLWVERQVADGQPHEADVYDKSGRHIAIAEWPAKLALTRVRHVIADKTMLAILTDADDIEQVVRVRFR